MKDQRLKLVYGSGFLGTAVVVFSSLITALFYEGTEGQSYSFLNHNISELGEIGVSELAPLFNLGLILGGLCFVVFMIALALYIQQREMTILSVMGVVAAIGIIFVGVFPVIPGESLLGHTMAALTFFLGGTIYFLSMTVYLIFSKQKALPPKFAIATALVTLSYLAFLFLPRLLFADLGTDTMLAGPSGPARPDFWLPSFLEWMILFTVVGWILLVSCYFFQKDRRQ